MNFIVLLYFILAPFTLAIASSDNGKPTCGETAIDEGTPRPYLSRLLGTSPAIQALREKIQQVAQTNIPVLIEGETGTGKELVAADIHYFSHRATKPYLPKNCGAVGESLLSSELFGHEKGSFTGATEQRIGYFELANGGTVFLDEIGEMPRDVQAHLLRVLETKIFERVGGKKSISSDFRIISATNVDLWEAVYKSKTFREDLYYRLAVITLTVPPLRDRLEDIPELVVHFTKKGAVEHGLPEKAFSVAALKRMHQHRWPGNVRELQNAVFTALFNSGNNPEVQPSDLPNLTANILREDPSHTDNLPTFEEAEYLLIKRALHKAGRGGSLEAARLLKTPHRTLLAKMARHKITE